MEYITSSQSVRFHSVWRIPPRSVYNEKIDSITSLVGVGWIYEALICHILSAKVSIAGHLILSYGSRRRLTP